MKRRVENVVEKGGISDDFTTSVPAAKVFAKWGEDFTPLNHPAVVEVELRTRDIDFFTP